MANEAGFLVDVTGTPTGTTANPIVTTGGGSGTGNVNLVQVGGSAIAIGQAAMAASLPVVIASNQSTLPANLAQVNAVTVLTGAGATGTGSERVTVAQDTTTIAGSAPGTAGTASANVVTIQGIASMTAVTVTGTVTATPTTSGTATNSNVASSASSVTIHASTAGRKGLSVYNDSTAILYLSLDGGTASTSNYTTQIGPQGFYELPPPIIYTGAITGIWASANGNARVTELT